MVFKVIWIIAIVAVKGEDSKTLFKWDITTLEEIFCSYTKESFLLTKQQSTKKDSTQVCIELIQHFGKGAPQCPNYHFQPINGAPSN